METEVGEQLGVLGGAADTMWLLVCALLVFLMQVGFMQLEAGSVQPKNARHILYKNIVDACIGILCFWSFGYAFAYGEDSNPFIGYSRFFLADRNVLEGDESPVRVSYAGFFFQAAFAVTAATIVSGAVAGRTRYFAYIVCAVFLTSFVYPVVVHWVWGGGWLGAGDEGLFGVGMIDFAGSAVVHMVGGIAAFAGATLVGFRNKFTTDPLLYPPRFEEVDGKWRMHYLPVNSLSLASTGTLLLWVCWFAFNCGSTLGMASAEAQFVGSLAAANTALAPSAAAFSASLMGKMTSPGRHFNIVDALNGILAGLVSITAGCAVVEPYAAVIIGALGGILYKGSSLLVRKLRVDDPLDAASVHGTCGAWGAIAVGIFARQSFVTEAFGQEVGAGFLYGGGGARFGAQIVGVLVIALWTAFWMVSLFGALKMLNLLRYSAEEEQAGIGNEDEESAQMDLEAQESSGVKTMADLIRRFDADPAAVQALNDIIVAKKEELTKSHRHFQSRRHHRAPAAAAKRGKKRRSLGGEEMKEPPFVYKH